MTSFHGQQSIAGARRGGPATFAVTSPLDGTTLPGRFCLASVTDADDAVRAAAAAFPSFAAASGLARATLLEGITEEILALGDGLIDRARRETALPEARLVGERGRTVGQLRLFAALARDGSWCDARIDPAQPDRQPLPRADIRRVKVPLGPVIVFGSSNFPLAFSVAGGDTASALATGNPVVVKAHRGHPGTSELVAGAIERAVAASGLPAGIFSLLHGEGATIGIALVEHPHAAAVGFTGSRAGGRALVDAAARRVHPIPVFAEMSSLNPVFMLPGALAARAEAIATGFVASMTLGVGQFCTKPGLVVGIEGPDFARFRGLLATAVSQARPGRMLTGDILAAYRRGSTALVASPGTALLATGITAGETDAVPQVAATSAAAFLAERRLGEEVFGPASLVVSAATRDELLEVARHLDGQLTATVHGTPADLEGAADLLAILATRAGRLIVNGFPTGVEVGHAMQHGGPWPATSDPRFTSVGSAAAERFVRPVCWQDVPDALLPPALQNDNPLGLLRLVDGKPTRDRVG